MSVWFEGAIASDLVVALCVAVAVGYKHGRAGLRGSFLWKSQYPVELRVFASLVVAYWVGGLLVLTYAAYLDSGPMPPTFPINIDAFTLFGLVFLNGVVVFWKRRIDKGAWLT